MCLLDMLPSSITTPIKTVQVCAMTYITPNSRYAWKWGYGYVSCLDYNKLLHEYRPGVLDDPPSGDPTQVYILIKRSSKW
jgi:hypothetical protein